MSNSFGLPLVAAGAAVAVWMAADSLKQQSHGLRQFREENVRLLRGAGRDNEPPAPSGVRVLALPPLENDNRPAADVQ
jgi:hypothetical protein